MGFFFDRSTLKGKTHIAANQVFTLIESSGCHGNCLDNTSDNPNTVYFSIFYTLGVKMKDVTFGYHTSFINHILKHFCGVGVNEEKRHERNEERGGLCPPPPLRSHI